jgi:hypothetical protein
MLRSGVRMPRLILVLLAGDLALGAAYLVNEIAGRPRDGLTRLVDLNGEANLPAWYSSMQGLAAALLLWTFVRRQASRTWVLWLAPILLFVISCDEVAQLHERVGGHSDALLPGGTRENTIFVHTGIWMFVIGVPFIVFLAWLLVRTRRAFAAAPGSTVKMVTGFGLLLCGSLVMDGLSNAFRIHSLPFNMLALIEEVLEMTGMTVICWAALDLAKVTVGRESDIAAALTDGMIGPVVDEPRTRPEKPSVQVREIDLTTLPRSTAHPRA